MKDGLLVVERIVLESLSKKDKNLQELMEDTRLTHALLKNILSQFISKNMLTFNKGIYGINEATKNEWLPKINARNCVKEEIKEIFVSMVNQYFDRALEKEANELKLKLKKIWLTPSEEKILNSHLYNLESFITNLEKDRILRPVKGKLCESKVILWGSSPYAALVSDILNAV